MVKSRSSTSTVLVVQPCPFYFNPSVQKLRIPIKMNFLNPSFVLLICLIVHSEASIIETLMTPVTWLMHAPAATISWIRNPKEDGEISIEELTRSLTEHLMIPEMGTGEMFGSPDQIMLNGRPSDLMEIPSGTEMPVFSDGSEMFIPTDAPNHREISGTGEVSDEITVNPEIEADILTTEMNENRFELNSTTESPQILIRANLTNSTTVRTTLPTLTTESHGLIVPTGFFNTTTAMPFVNITEHLMNISTSSPPPMSVTKASFIPTIKSKVPEVLRTITLITTASPLPLPITTEVPPKATEIVKPLKVITTSTPASTTPITSTSTLLPTSASPQTTTTAPASTLTTAPASTLTTSSTTRAMTKAPSTTPRSNYLVKVTPNPTSIKSKIAPLLAKHPARKVTPLNILKVTESMRTRKGPSKFVYEPFFEYHSDFAKTLATQHQTSKKVPPKSNL